VVDPISAYMGGSDGNNNVETREILEPLADMTNRLRIAVVAVNQGAPVSVQCRTAYQIKGRLILTDATAFLVFGYRNICLFEIIAFQRS